MIRTRHGGKVATSLGVVALTVFAMPARAQGVDSLRLRPGDAIRVAVRDEPSLSGEFPVGADSAVLLPELGPVRVVGRPFSDVVQALDTAFAARLVDPAIQVTPIVRVAVLGEVRRPGLFPVDPSLTLADVLASAGGLTPDASTHAIELVRNGTVVATRLDPQAPALGMVIRPGDQVFVRRRSWISQNTPFILGALGSVAAAAIASLIVK